MGLLDLFKKKKISINSANFARLVKFYCSQSGIPVVSQIKITKAIARDFIDSAQKTINDFFFMDGRIAKQYLIKNGLNALDAEIFWSIMTINSGNFLQTY
jgi:acid phosphatase class B